MSKGWYPIIDYEKCIGCMACIDMCRHGIYKRDTENGKPKVVYGNGCVHGCHGCERNCPVGAIHYFGDDGTLDIDYDYETYKPELKSQKQQVKPQHSGFTCCYFTDFPRLIPQQRSPDEHTVLFWKDPSYD